MHAARRAMDILVPAMDDEDAEDDGGAAGAAGRRAGSGERVGGGARAADDASAGDRYANGPPAQIPHSATFSLTLEINRNGAAAAAGLREGGGGAAAATTAALATARGANAALLDAVAENVRTLRAWLRRCGAWREMVASARAEGETVRAAVASGALGEPEAAARGGDGSNR